MRPPPAAPSLVPASTATPRAAGRADQGTATRAAAATPFGALASDLRSAGRASIEQAAFGKRPYLRLAFMNPYNLSLLSGGLAASVLTVNPFLAFATLGLEALWLLHAPDSARLRHLLWDPRLAGLRSSIEAAERAQRLAGLDSQARDRVEALVARRAEIQRLSAQNPSFTGDLLRNELVKTDRLIDAFVDMTLTCARYEAYLASVDAEHLERDRQRFARAEQLATQGHGADDQQAQIARKNLAIIVKRLDKMQEIQRYLSVARGQLDLIENSFQLIADQIVTMQSPQELSGQLDELLDGVEAIRETTRDTEKLLGSLEREM
jgi:hypothetical protein